MSRERSERKLTLALPPRRVWNRVTAALLSLVLMAAAGSIGLAVWTVTEERSDALVIDVAGRQRALAQEHMKLVLLRTVGHEVDLEGTRKLFRDSLVALRDGGPAVVDRASGETQAVPAAPGAELRQQLDDVGRAMERQFAAADALLASPRDDPAWDARLTALEDLNEGLTERLDAVVKMFERRSGAKVRRSLRWTTASAALMLLTGVGLYWQTRRVSSLNRLYLTEERRRTRISRHLDAVVSSAVDGIVTIDDQGIVQSLNPAAEAIFGYRLDELVGRKVSLLMPEPDRSLHDGYIERYRRTGRARIIGTGREVTGRRKDGSEFPMDLAVSEAQAAGQTMFVGIVRDISDQKRAAEALRRSEERFQLAVDGSSAGLWDWDLAGDTVWYSPRFKQLLGYADAEFPNTLEAVRAHLHPDDRERVDKAFEDHFGKHAPYDIEHRFRTQDGDYRWFHARGQALWGKDGKPQRMAGSITDVTAHKQAEEALRRSEERFQLAVRGSTDGLWDWDVVTNEVWYSPRFKEMLGYADDEFPNVFDSFETHLHPADREPTLEEVRLHLEERKPYDVEYRLRTKSGELRWFRARGQALWGDDGKAHRMAGSIADITDRKRDEEQLARQALEARLVHQATAMAAETQSLEMALQQCVDIVCEMTGWPVGHVYLPAADGRGLLLPADIWHLSDEAAFGTFREVTRRTPFERGAGLPGRIWASGAPAWIRNVQTDPNFPRAKLADDLGVKGAFGFPVKIAGETAAVLEFFAEQEMEPNPHLLMLVGSVGEQVGRVIERRRARESLLHAKEQAEAANTAKSRFLANMSHELRTPLNAIIGYSELLEEEVEEQGAGQFVGDLRKIRTAGKQLLGLINDVLDLSKVEAGRMDLEPETFDLTAMLRDTETTVRPLFERRGNVLDIDAPEDGCRVTLDRARLRQIVLNLVSNANKFTDGGTVRLTARKHRADRRDRIEIRVADTGIGMTEEQLARVFEPFSQADSSTTRKYGGTGLGLTICRRLCQLMGGEIDATSEPGEGSTFTVRLPMATATPDGEAAPTEAAAGGDTVLVIDDDPAVRDLMSRLLAKEGFSVLTAAGGAEGLELARTARPDVISLDVMMPRMDGWAVLTELKQDPELRGIPVVLVTMVDDRNLGFALGAADFLLKPIERGRLVTALGRFRSDAAPGSVLLVEDNEAVRDQVRRTLAREGWSISEAADGREALDVLGRELPDVILLDLMMPGMDGFQFIEEVRKEAAWSAVPIVVLTAKSLSAEERRRLHGRVERVLQKGAYSRAELLAEVARQVHRHARNGEQQRPAAG